MSRSTMIIDEDSKFLAKIVVCGSYRVGKSSIINRYTRDTFCEETKHNTGMDFGTKSTDDMRLQVWDTPSSLRELTNVAGFIRGALAAVFVFSVTSKQSLEEVENLLEFFADRIDPNCRKILVGNKTDLASQRVVSTQEASEFARTNHLIYVETSAKDKTNIDQVFAILAGEIRKEFIDKNNDSEITSTTNPIYDISNIKDRSKINAIIEKSNEITRNSLAAYQFIHQCFTSYSQADAGTVVFAACARLLNGHWGARHGTVITKLLLNPTYSNFDEEKLTDFLKEFKKQIGDPYKLNRAGDVFAIIYIINKLTDIDFYSPKLEEKNNSLLLK